MVFHLDPRAHWQDGQPVTAADVAFTFDIYTDSTVNSPFRSNLRTISAVTTRDSLTPVFRFHARYPEMFYDAVYHMRILPAHLLRPVPRTQWRSAAFGRAPRSEERRVGKECRSRRATDDAKRRDSRRRTLES